MLSLQTMFDPVVAGDFEATVRFRLGDVTYSAVVRQGRIDVRRGEPDQCDFTVTAEPAQLAGVVYGGAPIDAIRIDGDLALAKRFVTLFPLPPKVA
jgi:ubiquinone biosynthesis protein UbiJ